MLSESEVYKLLEQVPDPEIPSINIVELGIVHQVVLDDKKARVELTPTYSACPAIPVIEQEVTKLLQSHGIAEVEVVHVLEPAWTTDRLTDSARKKLKESAITPPGKYSAEDLVQFPKPKFDVACPRCDSHDTELQTHFGSTACKAMFVCKSCREPFEYFKTLK